MIENSIDTQIKKLRCQRGWTQEQLANKMGVSPQTVSNWETGMKVPRMKAFEKLAEIFNVKIGEIMNHSLSGQSPAYHQGKTVDLNDDRITFTFNGQPISAEDLKYIKRLLNSRS
ncbi:helix-turn-helix transcriptional regulator [Limosilactobacillus caecicola]|uniref:helix-turn-helix transcriptional regulator n=1 Tax=Limosilactobacillus caecicola TaxID=2941332 RepID=UPI00203CDDAE|nr:helix-turn-helix transcriptional regulator [Limosilactobacillus caecicola]